MTGADFRGYATGAAILAAGIAVVYVLYEGRRAVQAAGEVVSAHPGEPSLSNPVSRAFDAVVFGVEPDADGELAPKRRLGDVIYEFFHGGDA